jgi:sortase A
VLTTEAEVQEEAEPPRPPTHRIARVVGSVGRLMMTSGVVILLLVAYQLWGTNLQTNRSQSELADEFADIVDETPSTTASTTASTTTTTTVADEPPATTPAQVAPDIAPPAHGEPIGRFSIPAIGVTDFWTVEGTGTEELKRGAAHYPSTPLPGQAGNAAVAGHRTTYGAPLHNVEKLVPGDEITFTTVQGTFTYRVIETLIVEPEDVWVIEPRNPTPEKPEGDDLLTLTACHPKFSAEQRIIVVAALVGTPVPQIEGQAEAAEDSLAQSDSGSPESGAIDEFADEPMLTFPGAWWGLLCMVLWGLTRLLAWYGHRSDRFPRFVPYLIGTPICLLVLYLFFESFSFEGFARTVGLSI